MKTIIVILMGMSFVGCASTRVAKIGPDTYFIQREGGAGAVGTAPLRMEAIEDANAHCEKMGKKAVVVSMNENPTNGWNYPSADVQFRCLTDGDADMHRPTLEKAPQTTIQVKTTN